MAVPVKLIPNNPRANYLAYKKEINDAITRVLDSGMYVLGKEVNAFEKEFAAYIGVRFAIGVGSGTDALLLALRACGIGTGDEVITVSHTAVATVAAIEICGATPVLVDIDLNTYTIDPIKIKKAITQRTRAIIPVHLYGHPADMESIMRIANHLELVVIEDCAQSHGAEYKGHKTGAWGHIAIFSFYPTKNLGAIGDGGMAVTSDVKLAERIKLLREYGWRQRYISEFPGFNSRLDELQAAILRVKLRYLDIANSKRQKIAKVYEKLLSTTNLRLPTCIPGARHVYNQYVVSSKHRDSLIKFLHKKRIGALIHYPVPIHKQPAYRDRLQCVGSMRNTEKVVREIIGLPIYPELPIESVRQVAEIIISWMHNQQV